jgi:hypothetical protein
MELTKAEQTPEAHAFLYKRTEAKYTIDFSLDLAF